MDATTFIFIVILGMSIVACWKYTSNLAIKVAELKAQMGRFISDIESEKGTRRRTNHDLTNRIRILEGQKPLPPYDDTKD